MLEDTVAQHILLFMRLSLLIGILYQSKFREDPVFYDAS